jgi:hypothetical protein
MKVGVRCSLLVHRLRKEASSLGKGSRSVKEEGSTTRSVGRTGPHPRCKRLSAGDLQRSEEETR